MTVRKLRAKQRGPFCSFGCSVRATHRGCGFTKFACAEHLHVLQFVDTQQSKRDSYQSDAEWQLGI